MAKASDVAKFFLMMAHSGEEDAGEAMTHLKLQKLLYYAQGFHIALNAGKPLFTDSIEAWDHGPVVNALWGVYKTYGSQPIPSDEDFDANRALSEAERELLNDVWNTYGQFSAWKLREMTHNEPPWKKNYRKGENAVISNNCLLDYFSTQIEP